MSVEYEYHGTDPMQQDPMYFNPAFAGNYAGAYFPYAPVYQNQQLIRQDHSSLTEPEIQELNAAKPNAIFNLNVENDEVLRAICNHQDANADLVKAISDGTNDVFCTRCKARWDTTPTTWEQVEIAVKQVIDAMQNLKWMANLPTNMTREYFTMIPLLKRFPELFKYGMALHNKNFQASSVSDAQNAGAYQQYNMLFGNNMGMNGYAYNQPYQQQYAPMGTAYSNNYGNYYQQVPAPQGQVANAYANPMYAAPVQQQCGIQPGVMPYQQNAPYGNMPNPYAMQQQAVDPAVTAPTFATPNGAQVTTNTATGESSSKTTIEL